MPLDTGLNRSYEVDYRHTRLGLSYEGWAGFSGALNDKMSFSTSARIENFYSDSTGHAVNPDEINELIKQWKTIRPNIKVIFSPNNYFSLTASYQRLVSDFSQYFIRDGYINIDEEKFFFCLTYKPTTGDYIYFGFTYPDKIAFFKFTHRFDF